MKNNNSFGFALIGCGRIASKHAKAIADSDGCHITSFVDIEYAKADLFAKSYGGTSFSDYRYVLDDKRIDIVNICTPSFSHHSIALDAIKCGKHVIIEKPIAMNLENAKEIIDASKKYGVKVCVVLQNRYNLPMQKLHKCILANLLGDIRLVNTTVRWHRDQDYYEDEWHGRMDLEGGVILNQAIHCLDAIEWLAGPVSSVQAQMGVLSHEMEAPDSVVALLNFKNGGLGTIEVSTIAYPENLEASITILGQNGTVKIGGKALNKIDIWKVKSLSETVDKSDVTSNEGSYNLYGSGHKMVVQDMIEAIKIDRQPKTNADEGLKSLRLALALIESATSLHSVLLE